MPKPLILCGLVLFLVGCGRHLNGVYESSPEETMAAVSPGFSPEMKQMATSAARAAGLTMRMEFNGDKANVSVANRLTICRYSIEDNIIKFEPIGGPDASKFAVYIQPDGSLKADNFILRKK